jgi:hypothetical protein
MLIDDDGVHPNFFISIVWSILLPTSTPSWSLFQLIVLGYDQNYKTEVKSEGDLIIPNF